MLMGVLFALGGGVSSFFGQGVGQCVEKHVIHVCEGSPLLGSEPG